MIALADATAPLGLVVPLCDVREAALVRGGDVHGAATLGDLARVLRGQADWPEPPPPSRLPPTGPRARPGRRPGPGGRPPGARGRGGRAPPPPHDRTARVGQDDAGRAPGRAAPAAHPRRGAHRHPHPLGRRLRAARRRALPPPAVPGPAPPGLHRLAGRWRQLVAPARRGEPRHPRRPLPRRARRVPRGRPRGAPPAARGGGDPGEPRRWHRHLPGGLPPRRRHEPLPVRRGRLRGRLHLQRRRPRPVPPPASRRRCWTVSTSSCPSAGPTPTSSSPASRASPRRPWRPGWRPPGHAPRRDRRPSAARTSRPTPRRCSARSSGRAPSAPAGCTRSRRWPGRSPTSPGRTTVSFAHVAEALSLRAGRAAVVP